MKNRCICILLFLVMILGNIVVYSAEVSGINLVQKNNVKVYLKNPANNAELPPSGTRAAEFAIDGDPSTGACAANCWAWMLEVDMGEKYNIGQVALTFGDSSERVNYPTHYKISVSENGSVWRDMVTVSDNKTADRREADFVALNTRYVRVTDLKAYEGISQMEIAEIEIYETTSEGMSITMTKPLNNKVRTDDSEPISVSFSEDVPLEYLAGIKVIGSQGEVECYKQIKNYEVELMPKEKLLGGKYDVYVQAVNVGTFYAANKNLTKTAKARMVSPSDVTLTVTPYDSNADRSIGYALDGNKDTYAQAYRGVQKKTYFELDFGRPYENINRINLTLNHSRYGAIEVLTSDDGLNWNQTHVLRHDGNNDIEEDFPPVTARYLRISAIDGWEPFAISEVDVLSIPSSEEMSAKINAPESANGDICIEFDDGVDFNTIAGNIKLSQGSMSTPCAERSKVECEYVAGKTSNIVIMHPKAGLEYGKEYVVNISDKVQSVWGNKTKKAYKEFIVEPQTPLEITTKSSTEYMQDKDNSIYPAFVDNYVYEAWTMEGDSHYYQIDVKGGKQPYSYSISRGALPDGLVMSTDGKISGKATKEGLYDFTVSVTDAAGQKVEKQLTMEAKPYRAKWYDDARFGVMTQFSIGIFDAGVQFKTTNAKKEVATNFEKNAVDYEPAEWAQELYEQGVEVTNLIAIDGYGSMLWPSKVETTYNIKTERNYMQEFVDECHKRGIKIMAYIAPDYGWAGVWNEQSAITGNRSEVAIGVAGELIEMGFDGIWCDSGYPDANIDWKKFFSTIRTINPNAVTVTNSAPLADGYVPHYPYVDIQNWESDTATGLCPDEVWKPTMHYTGYKTNLRRKIGCEATLLLCPHWGYAGHGDVDRTISQPVEDIVEVIQSNWDEGLTVMAVFCPSETGKLVPDVARDKLNQIFKWVRENKEYSNTPVASIPAGTYEGSQIITLEGNGKIYFTLDGSRPTEESILYTGPIQINDSTRIKAAAFEEGKGKSRIMDNSYIIKGMTNNSKTYIDENLKVNIVDPKVSTMAGIQIRVGAKPIKLRAIGRYATGNDGAGHLLTVKPKGGHPIHDDLVMPLLHSEIDMSIGEADENGYKWKEIAPIVLEPLQTYYIVCEETPETSYANLNDFSNISVDNTDLSYVDGIITDYTMSLYYKDKYDSLGDTSDKQQLLNIKYDVLEADGNIDIDNIALNAKLTLQDNNGVERNPSAWVHYADNAIDNDLSTYAAAGEAYAWTLHVDLKKEYENINKVKVTMGDGTGKGFATIYQIDASTDNKTWTTITYVDDNAEPGEKIFIYTTPFNARYLRVRSIKPDGSGQTGGQMAIAELSVYQEK